MSRAERERLLPPRIEDGTDKDEGSSEDHQCQQQCHRPYGGLLPVGQVGDAIRTDSCSTSSRLLAVVRRFLPQPFAKYKASLVGLLLLACAGLLMLVVSAVVASNLMVRGEASGIGSSNSVMVKVYSGEDAQHQADDAGISRSGGSSGGGGDAAVVDSSAGLMSMGTGDGFLHSSNNSSSSSSSSSSSGSSSGNPSSDEEVGAAGTSSRTSTGEARGGSGGDGGGAQQQPNVVFIMIDDVGMNDIGHQSTDLGELTPFMDSLSAQGVRLSKYYTNHLCTPSRSSLMTGRDTFRTGMQFEVVENSAPWGLPLNETTLAERFKTAGYSTHMAGKWHLGMFSDDHYPFSRGFDTFLGYMGGSEGYQDHAACETATFKGAEYECFNDFGYGDHDGYINHSTNTTRWGPRFKGDYSTSVITDRAIEVAHEHRANDTRNPLFLYVAYQAAHDPVHPPPEDWFSEEEIAALDRVVSKDPWRQRFARVILYLDKEIRRLHAELDSLGVLDNALVVLASDNGACPIRGGSNYPFRGFKHTLFEGGVRVPAFVYSKSVALVPTEARGRTFDGMMHATDWTPTLASIVPGLPLDELGLPLSGFDQWGAILGQRSDEVDGAVRREVVLGRSSYMFDQDLGGMVLMPGARGGYINNGWKILMGERCTSWVSFNPADLALADLGCDSADLCTSCISDCGNDLTNQNDFMFHVETDPYETVDLKEEMPDKFNEMVELWNLATEEEVFPLYRPDESAALERWRQLNDWVVAWR